MEWQPLVVQDFVIIEASWSYSDTPDSLRLLWTSDSGCGTELYLTTHNTHNRQISTPPLGFEPAIPGKRAAADPRLRSRGHWDWQTINMNNVNGRTTQWSSAVQTVSTGGCKTEHAAQGLWWERHLNDLSFFFVNNQFDAQFFLCLFVFSTCFGQPCAHHQENYCISATPDSCHAQFFLCLFLFSTCFGQPCAHHQENYCISATPDSCHAQFFLCLFLFSTCFGQPCAHHQENYYISATPGSCHAQFFLCLFLFSTCFGQPCAYHQENYYISATPGSCHA